MNWYHNNAGAAEGPLEDDAMTALAREKKLSPDSLVWHAGLDAWQSVEALSPAWWAASLPKPAGKPAQEAEKTAGKSQAADARRMPAPNAPTKEEDESRSGGGLLRRLFGFGKKKA